MNQETLLHFNGVNGSSGGYGLPPMTGRQLAQIITGETKPENLNDLELRGTAKAMLGIPNLEEAGWGIVLAHNADPAILQALSELLSLRQQQAGDRFKVFSGTKGVRPAETKTQFLARHEVGPGPPVVDKVPYYLLLVGGPEELPFSFQYQLDVQYAVGRIHFETLDGYEQYARNVVAAETGQLRRPRTAAFFGVANADDPATQLSADHLAQPLYEHFQHRLPDWECTPFVRDAATKTQLQRLLGGEQTPALLFTTSHGMEFPLDDPRQLEHQGALLCQDWPGPQEHRGRVPQDWYVAGDDLTTHTDLQGLITFHFACYGAGTPQYDQFYRQAFKDERAQIAPHSFLARLPTRLLNQGALAVIGHVERAWGYSFFWPNAGEQTEVFKQALHRLFAGDPVGHAMDFFDSRYAELSSDLNIRLDDIDLAPQKNYDPYELAAMWTANNDARGYVVLGDPAVRLPVEGTTPVLYRPSTEITDWTTLTSAASKPAQERPGVSDKDWKETPPSVKIYVTKLEEKLRELKP